MAAEFDYSEVQRHFVYIEKASKEVLAMAKLAVEKTALDVIAGAQAIVPVDTGNLKSTIGRDLDDDGLGAVIGPTAEYGGYVELGTSRMAPQPYLVPAFNAALPAFDAAIEQITVKAFE